MARNIPRRLNGDWRDYQKLSQLHLPADKLHELEQLLNTAHAKYLQDLDTIAEDASAWARSLVEKHEAYMLEDDLRDYVDAAGAASTEYYDAVRQAWADAAGKQFPDFQHDRTASPEHTLWNVVGGTNHTDKPGYKFADMIAGKVPGMTIHSLFPSFTSTDDAEQFAADMVRQAARDTMVMHQRRDPTKPRYARVPQGKVTCAFCLMLASRGFAYHSEESAGLFHTYHRHCDCQIVPRWGEQHLQGYDPEEMSSLYESAKHQTASKDYREILKTLRRIAPSQLKDGVQPKQQPQTKPWPEDVIRFDKNDPIWNHIFTNHLATSTIPKKTHFPSSWSEEMIKTAVIEVIVNHDDNIIEDKNGFRRRVHKLINNEYIEVYLKKTHKTHGKYAIQSAYPWSQEQRKRYGK